MNTSAIKNSKIELKHDFVTKMRQPSLLPRVKNYIAWRKSIKEGSRSLESLMPVSINLDLTTACNFRCDHCIDIDSINTGIMYDHDKLLSSLTNMIERGLRSVIIIGGGEPTIYPKFRDVVLFLKKHGVNIAIVSNGSRNEKIYDIVDCLDSKDWIRLSLDAGSNATFAKIHNPKQNVLLKNICSWIPRIRKRNPKVPVGFSFIITWNSAKNKNGKVIVPNINEIITATKLARDYDFNYISFKPFLTRYPDESEVMDPTVITDFEYTINRINESLNKARAYYEREDFKIIESANLLVLKNDSWRELTHQPKECHMQVFRQVLSPIGLFNCPGFRGVIKSRIADKNAYADINRLRITQKSVASILDRFDARSECANVTCLFNSVNRWMEKAISGTLNPAYLEPLEERNDYYF